MDRRGFGKSAIASVAGEFLPRTISGPQPFKATNIVLVH
jgi:hypothetical protein